MLTATIDRDDAQRQVFRTRFLPNLLSVAAWSIVFSVPVFTWEWYEHGLDVWALTWALVTMPGVLVALTMLLTHFMTIEVSERGLRSYASFPGRWSVDWDEIEGHRSLNLAGLRYVLVWGRRRYLKLWLPTWLEEPERFRRAVGPRLSGANARILEYFR